MPRWPWQKNKQPSVDVQVPPEVEEYYKSTKKDRRGLAWLTAFAALILTLLIAAALFFAGRWIYRAITDGGGDESAETTETDQEARQEAAQEDESQFEADPGAPGDTNQNQPEDQPQNGQDAPTNTLPSGPGSEEQNDSRNDNSTGTNGQDQTPITGPRGAEIPRTGPASEE